MSVKSVRLSDVAAASGVSLSTASKVLNGGGRVAPATRTRILETAARLDFRPNALAKSFALGRSYTIGILADNAPATFSVPVLIGASSALSIHDMATLVYDAENDPALRQEYVRRMRTRHVDGMLVIGQGPDIPRPSVSHGFPTPVVYAFGYSENRLDASFFPDNVMAGRLAGEHLVGLGRRRIAHITSAQGLRAVTDRYAGLAGVLAQNDLHLVNGSPLYGEFRRGWGARATRSLIESGADFDAIFAGNDEIAMGAYAALREAGRSVPDDVAIIGVDNFKRLSSLEDRFLTTIDPNLAQVGADAANHIMLAIGGEYQAGVFTVPATLVEGRSTLGRALPDSPEDVPEMPEG